MVGGARVSFQHLVDYLKEEGIPFYLVETRPFEQGWLRILNPLLVIWRCLWYLRRVDVVWGNMSYGGIRLFGPVLYLLARLGRKPIVLRPFGSRLRETYDSLSGLAKWGFERTVLQADLLFLQTQSLINYFQPLSRHLAHLPTSRELPAFESEEIPRTYRKRFAFLGHLKKVKGIDEILAVWEQLPEEYVIHLYGPIKEEQYDYLASERIIYQGVLSSREVLAKLDEYDVLLLPTYFSGEGYPGAIIEAYSLGMPVISTQWRSIPEIVLDGETGRLIAPRDSDALLEGILGIDEVSYRKWSIQARQQFEVCFEQKKVLEHALENIRKLMPLPISEQA